MGKKERNTHREIGEIEVKGGGHREIRSERGIERLGGHRLRSRGHTFSCDESYHIFADQ